MSDEPASHTLRLPHGMASERFDAAARRFVASDRRFDDLDDRVDGSELRIDGNAVLSDMVGAFPCRHDRRLDAVEARRI